MLGRSVALNVLGSATGLAVGFVASLLLGRYLGASERGLLGVMSAFSSVGVGVLGIGMPTAVMFYASQREARGGALLGNSLAWGLLLAAVLVPVVWLAYRPLSDVIARSQGDRAAWVLAAALVPLTFVDWTTHNQLLGRLRFGLYNVLVVLSKLATLVLVVALVVVFRFGLVGALLATGAASLVMIMGSLPPLVREARPSLDPPLLRRLIAYGSRVQLGTIFQLLNYRLDVLILQAFAPLRVVGYYVVAQIMAELSTTIASSFGTSILPLVAHAGSDEERDTTTADSLRHHGIVTAVTILGNAGFGAAVIWWGYGSQYHSAVVPMLILLPSMWFLGTGQVVTGDLRGRGRPGLSSLLAGITAAVTVALDLLLIPPFGANGAALASAAAYCVFGAGSLIAISRLSGQSVRSLVVPSRGDFAAYPAAARALRTRLRGRDA